MSKSLSSSISPNPQACAACKYLRRKCASDCVFAPYFPRDQQTQFLNAHKLFGVSNICKLIKNMSPPDRKIAMVTIIYQSNIRAKYPVEGCARIIRCLIHAIKSHLAELELLLQSITLSRAHQEQEEMDKQEQEEMDISDYNDHECFQVISVMQEQEYVTAQEQLDDNDRVHATENSEMMFKAENATLNGGNQHLTSSNPKVRNKELDDDVMIELSL